MPLQRAFISVSLLSMFLTACGGSSSDEQSENQNSDQPVPLLSANFVPLSDEFGVPNAQFADDIKYGDDERQRFDFYKPASDQPTGLVIYIHGGGFRGGHESKVESKFGDTLPELLRQGYAIASTTYRVIDGSHDEGVIRSLQDSTYALQFMRYHAENLNIDSNNIILSGGSAGASTSLWIGLQPDMANPDAEDPVERQSTQVKAIAIENTQSTLDIQRWQEDETIFAEFNLSNEEAVALGGGASRALDFYGVEASTDNLADPIASWQTAEIIAYRQSVDMLDFFSSDDPELFVNNPGSTASPTDGGNYLHHAWHGRALHLAAEAASVPGKFYYGPESNRAFASEPLESFSEFLFRKLAE